jgi:(2Fe-2S) ferredoxin
MPVYEKHVFVCTRGEWCPSVDGDGLGVHAALKEAVREAGIGDRVRINHAGCFSQCGNGPMAVVYPDDVWYAALSPADAFEIVQRHVVGGEPVERLRYEPAEMGAHKLERDAEGRPIGRTAPWPAGGTR